MPAKTVKKPAVKAPKLRSAKPKRPLRGKKGTVLSGKQELFCTEYIKCGNASQAYKASYKTNSMSTAAVYTEASKLLKNPVITLRISGLQAKVADDAILTKRESLIEASKMARFDIRKMFDKDGAPIPIHLLDDTTAAAIVGLDVLEEFVGTGKDRVFIGHVKKYKIADKNASLEKLFKHHGLYEKDNEQRTNPITDLLKALGGRSAFPVVGDDADE